MEFQFFQNFSKLSSNKLYVIYSMAYGLSSLIIPFGIQYLVNSLTLSGIWFNSLSFLMILTVGLTFSQIFKHSLVILLENLQREILVSEMEKWKNFSNKDKSYYFFEVPNLLKSFSKAYSHLIELGLLLGFGLVTIILFHPAFLLLPLMIGLVLWQIYKTFIPAIKGSIAESNQKYEIHEYIHQGGQVNDSHIDSYLNAREVNFSFTKINSFKICAIIIICQAILLGIGSFLIQKEQLSVGQLVSAEIILSGIIISLLKLPQTFESIFNYETSQYKIAKALKV